MFIKWLSGDLKPDNKTKKVDESVLTIAIISIIVIVSIICSIS